MKKILRIARLELSIMFYSPIAWLVLILFIIQSGVVYAEMLYDQETRQQLGRALPPMSKVLFAGEDGVLAKIQRNLYLYIPILTMGLMSRETSSGSIKLLYSSPVTVFQIVFGKYLSMVCYAFLLCLVLATYLITGTYSIVELDLIFVMGGIFGVFLLICAYAAIGLFMSSLTNYQVVAAISTLAVLAVLNFIGGIGQQYDFVRDVTYWFSISGRADNMVNGLIISKDVIYFVLVIVMFIGFILLKLNDERDLKSGIAKWSRYTLLIVGITAVGYLSSRPVFTAYYDSTRFNDRTLTQNSIDLLEQLEDPITITTYVNLVHYSAKQGSPINRINDLQHFDQYRRFLPNMEMPYIAYYDTLPYKTDTTKTLLQKAKSAASAHKFDFDEILTPTQIRAKIDLLPEQNRLVRIISYKDKITPLRMFDDLFVYPNENEISVAIKRLLNEPAKIGFVGTHGERSLSSIENGGYQVFSNGTNIRGSLVNQGFETETINLKKVDAIPNDIKALVIADPKSPYTEKELDLIHEYIASGRNLLLALEPDSTILNSVLDSLGVGLKTGVLLEESEDYDADLIQAKYTKETSDIGIRYRDNFVVSMPTAAGLTINDSITNFKSKLILITNKKMVWNNTEEFDLETEQVSFDPENDSKVELPLAVALTRTINSKNQKIVVLSDADFMSNAEMARNNLTTRNSVFTMGLFKWLNDGEYPFSSPRSGAIDTTIKVDRTGILWIKVIYMGLFPGIVALFGLILLTRRKRK